MKRTMLKFMYIKWLDASSQASTEWLKIEDLNPEVIIETAGFLIKETNTYYSISMERWKEDERFKYISHIPKAYILKKRIIKMEEL